jgi:hypothetical protein
MKLRDEPLLVLKYLKRRMIVTIMGSLVLLPMFFYGLFGHASRSTFELIMVQSSALIFISVAIPALIDMLLFGEKRLYKDRIVKVWKLIGARELKLAEVGLRCQNIMGVRKKGFFKQGRNPYWGWIPAMFRLTGISYSEMYADQGRVRRLNCLLAELSGRKIEEFEQTATIEKLIKGGQK